MKDLRTDDDVLIKSTGSSIDGQVGKVLGEAVMLGVVNFYIIMLEHPYTDQFGKVHKATVIPDSCLTRI